jgi:hypothetical protein
MLLQVLLAPVALLAAQLLLAVPLTPSNAEHAQYGCRCYFSMVDTH